MQYLLLIIHIGSGIIDRFPHEIWYLIPLNRLDKADEPTLEAIRDMSGGIYHIFDPETIMLPVRENRYQFDERPTSDELVLQSILKEIAGTSTSIIKWEIYQVPVNQPFKLARKHNIKEIVEVHVEHELKS